MIIYRFHSSNYAPADCCGKLCRTKSHRRQNAADIEVVRRVLDTAVDCGCVLSAGLAAAGRAEYKGGCVAAGGCTRVHEEFRGQCFVFLLVFCWRTCLLLFVDAHTQHTNSCQRRPRTALVAPTWRRRWPPIAAAATM